MTQNILNLTDLRRAMEENPKLVEHYRSQVTVEKDLKAHLKWLNDEELTTTIEVKLKRNKMRSPGIHPSAACKEGVCLLRLYYDCTHDIPPRRQYVRESQITWDIGTMLHYALQKWFSEMYGYQFQEEVPLKDDKLHIKSHADGLFTFRNYRFILEIKSIKEGGSYGFETVQLKPMADNVRQAHFYMYLADVPFALLFYLCKNNSKWKEHPVVFDFDLWDSIVKDVVVPTTTVAYGTSGTVTANPGWGCRWCDYEHACPEAKSYKSRGDANAAKNARKWSKSSW